MWNGSRTKCAIPAWLTTTTWTTTSTQIVLESSVRLFGGKERILLQFPYLKYTFFNTRILRGRVTQDSLHDRIETIQYTLRAVYPVLPWFTVQSTSGDAFTMNRFSRCVSFYQRERGRFCVNFVVVVTLARLQYPQVFATCGHSCSVEHNAAVAKRTQNNKTVKKKKGIMYHQNR